MTKMWAVEKYVDHWDGYSGHTEPAQAGERPNNYYLYSEPSGRFQMLPWGADQTWIPTIGVETPGREVTFDGPGGILFNKCLEDEACFDAYWEALHGVREAIAQLDPAALAESTVAMLAPWQQAEEEDGRPEYTTAEIKEDKYGVDTTLAFINGRAAEADAWLDANEPEEESGEEEGEGEPEGKEPAAPAKPVTHPSDPPVPTAAGPLVPDLVPGRFVVTDGVLIARVWVSGAGTVEQRASIATRRGRLRVCATDAQPRQAGPLVLRCKLTGAARRRLSKKSLQLRAYTTFIPLGRPGMFTVHNLAAPRDPSL